MKQIGKKPRSTHKNLSTYVKKIQEQAGIEVKTLSDLVKLREQIDFWTAKYKEAFEQKQSENDEKLTFMQLLLGVFAANQMNIIYEMPLTHFFELKERAEKLAQKVINPKEDARD